MVNIGELEIIATENSIISKKEEIYASELKRIAKAELKKAQARENFLQKTLELSKIKYKLAEKNKEIIDRKMKNKVVLKIPDIILNNEREYTVHNERVAKIQDELAKIHKTIADIEREIAEERIKLANRKIFLAKERRELSKLQFSYIKKVKKSHSKEKILDAKNLYLNKQTEIEHARDRVLKKINDIRKKENNIAELKGKLSVKLVEQAKL